MEQAVNEDFDCFLLRMKREFAGTAGKREPDMEEKDFGLGFRIRILRGFEEADREEAADIFRSENRPPILLTAPDRMAGMTFQRLEEKDSGGTAGLKECMENIRRVLGRVDDRTVFYDTGEEGSVVWQEYKSFASDERVYNIVFLFHTGAGKVMGTFYCIYDDYERWKPIVLLMLNTITGKEDTDEGI